MKEIITILLFVDLFSPAKDGNCQINTKHSDKDSIHIDTEFYYYEQGMGKEAFFILKFYKSDIKRQWRRQVYDTKGHLLAEGYICMNRRKFKIPNWNYHLIGKWKYYDKNNNLLKERDYGDYMKEPEMLIEKHGNFSLQIW
jgi:hypothetical protein